MNVSDAFLECSGECARLSRQCRDEKIAAALLEVSARLFHFATRAAELVLDQPEATPQPALHAGAGA
jgi:hypothetical protein